MKKLLCFIVTFWVVAGVASSAWSQDDCKFSPAFQQVRSTLDGLSPLDATKALQALSIKSQSPELCEAAALDDALGEREKLLVALVGKNGNENAAQMVFRCNIFNAKTASCQSPNEDGTAHPNLTGTLTSVNVKSTDTFDIKSRLPDAKLYAVYLTTLSRALDGKPAKRLSAPNGINAKSLTPATVLIAIYKTQGARSSAWAYQKAVWYF
jgi:hypothetical protein